MNAHTDAANHPLTPTEAARASQINEMQREFSRRLAALEANPPKPFSGHKIPSFDPYFPP